MKVIIVCGVSGSGKSTYIQNSIECRKALGADTVCSADHFFLTADGDYFFDPSKLGEAHADCLKKFVSLIFHRDGVIVVDNTNTSMMEIAPYAQLAIAYGHELEIVIIEADPEKAHARNTHGVPKQGVMGQHDRLVKTAESLPPWWPVTKIQMSE